MRDLVRKCDCYGCNERSAECHSTCEKYITWLAAHKEEKQRIQEIKKKEGEIKADIKVRIESMGRKKFGQK